MLFRSRDLGDGQGVLLHPDVHLEFVSDVFEDTTSWNMGTSGGNSVCAIRCTWSCIRPHIAWLTHKHVKPNDSHKTTTDTSGHCGLKEFLGLPEMQTLPDAGK